MTKCDIHIRMLQAEDIPENMGDTGLSTQVTLIDADITDRMMLMHTLGRVLNLDKEALMLFGIMEQNDVFAQHEIQIRMPGGTQNEG